MSEVGAIGGVESKEAASEIRRLRPEDAALYRELRLEALLRSPEAFSSTYEAEVGQPLTWFADWLASSAVFGAFTDSDLLGIATFYIPSDAKEAHKGMLAGMYVRPAARRMGIARQLVECVLSHAREHVELVELAVVSENEAARRLYAAFGFTEYAREKNGLKDSGRYYDCVLMSKPFMRSPLPIRPACFADAAWISGFLRKRWNATTIVVHGEVIEAVSLPALIAENRRGLATFRRLDRDAELVTLDADPIGVGTGTALVEALVSRLRDDGCERLWLTTTNDKLSALRFYLRRHFRLIQVRLGAVDDARRLKPSIPTVGEYGIPIRDELDLCRVLDARIARRELFLPPWPLPASKWAQASDFHH
jgi:ribosomal protein S18 acetylase RimI-like enzyme